MTETAFALFVDVLGTQQALIPKAGGDEQVALNQCKERLEDFHNDLKSVIELPLALAFEVAEPSFVAEFSDCAFIVAEQLSSVLIPALSLMRRALRHTYPLRGGMGVGTFFHESSGAHMAGQRQIRSTSSFLGSSTVRAYEAERSKAPGMRVLVHPLVIQQTGAQLLPHMVPLTEDERSAVSTHELRIWDANDAPRAINKVRNLRDSQDLSDRAKRHYDATIAAYETFANIADPLPHVLPALWL